ncbi:MAG: hypothetical protein JWN07_3301 [Hyphomicrobiales bacterium]|nr:hypothetical protein [Hyphomicrobiales bacterium]
MLKLSTSLVAAGALSLALAGCASTGPAVPNVAVMPAKGKSYEAFQRDDAYCQANAQRAVGYQSPGATGNDEAVRSAAIGTGLGALAGAAIGSASGNLGRGAAIGAGTGLLAGALVGSGNAREAGGAVQGRYDLAYAQCMRARGHDVIAEAPPRREVVYVERPAPVYVYPRPYHWGPGYRRPYYW